MKNKGSLISILLMIVIVIGAAGGFFVLQSKQVAPTEVYVWAADGLEGKVITEEDLEVKTIPADGIQPGMVKVGGAIEIDGRHIPALEYIIGSAVDTAVYQGEYVTANALVKPEDIDPFALMDLSNYRKYALSTSLLATICGNIEAGDRIDLYQTISGSSINEDGTSESWTYTKIFMENVLVYKVLTGTGEDHTDNLEHEGATYTTPATIILALTIDQFEEIITRETLGPIRFVTRFEGGLDANSEGFTTKKGQDGYIQFVPDKSYEIYN